MKLFNPNFMVWKISFVLHKFSLKYLSHFRAVSLCVVYQHLKTFPASLNTLICLLKTFQSQHSERFWRTSVNSKQPEYLEKVSIFFKSIFKINVCKSCVASFITFFI